jgi:hypothetical protein
MRIPQGLKPGSFSLTSTAGLKACSTPVLRGGVIMSLGQGGKEIGSTLPKDEGIGRRLSRVPDPLRSKGWERRSAELASGGESILIPHTSPARAAGEKGVAPGAGSPTRADFARGGVIVSLGSGRGRNHFRSAQGRRAAAGVPGARRFCARRGGGACGGAHGKRFFRPLTRALPCVTGHPRLTPWATHSAARSAR